MEEDTLDDIKAQFGDRVYVIKEGATYYKGNDDEWYKEDGSVVS